MNQEATFARLAFGPDAWDQVHQLGWTTDTLMDLILQAVDPLDNREDTSEEYFNGEYERFVDDVRTKVVTDYFHFLF